MSEIISKERFVKNINLCMFKFLLVSEDEALKIFNGILVHFPNKKEELEHYCFKINFGKPTSDSEYLTPEDFYDTLI